MSVRIRMVRQGRKNEPHYRIVVTDKKKRIDGAYIEKLGVYNSKAEDEKKVIIKEDRLKYWLKQGAQMSDSLSSILKNIERRARVQ
ncbi:MAG: 30S ribosomal protein S16 [Planctomycetota bacterium]|nr:30S ribosomal protein S16 [Planctomycetota bacterium]MDI6787561.1 30S ribosomal protein S16 [Planctomycetota bacterium]